MAGYDRVRPRLRARFVLACLAAAIWPRVEAVRQLQRAVELRPAWRWALGRVCTGRDCNGRAGGEQSPEEENSAPSRAHRALPVHVPHDEPPLSQQLEHGVQLWKAGELERSRGILCSAATQHPAHLAAVRVCADSHDRDRGAEAAHWRERAVSLDPTDAEMWMRVASLGHGTRQRECATRAAALDPTTTARVLDAAVRVRKGAGRLDEAVAMARLSIAALPTRSLAWGMAADLLATGSDRRQEARPSRPPSVPTHHAHCNHCTASTVVRVPSWLCPRSCTACGMPPASSPRPCGVRWRTPRGAPCSSR